ncbi:ABC transporter substrate-binding protein [Cochlodiniinecator piscidefendens]|uniref:ABC transporter substrate-binding protein n=1 Tax=Cochlodiniinecator piscidefendens TaxID=2715756 RepID=UPI001409709A|nr:ABC transporter substrate-binding protein [Cochlodiniinecator piscidefendens]
MRFFALSAFLIGFFTTAPLGAFEIETETLFEVDQPTATLRVISTSDQDLFTPMVLAFQAENPTVSVAYTSVSSTELMQAVYSENVPFDVAISSAMDLQVKLANDGFTQPYQSAQTNLLPDWGNWRGHVFAFTQEPASIVISPSAFAGLSLPETRQELIQTLRENPDRFRNRIGTYDVRTSGLGYLFATQDARTSETYWRLMEVMGGLGTQLYCCSNAMIDDVQSGTLAVGYNVLGSYADARKAQGDDIHVIAPRDFTTVMLRSAVIPVNAPSPTLAQGFVDHLLLAAWGSEVPDYYPFPPIANQNQNAQTSPRPIRLGPGLLVFLDQLKRRLFLEAWTNAVVQP